MSISKNKKRRRKMEELPVEVLLHILASLSPCDWCSVSLVSSKLKGVAEDNALWVTLIPESWKTQDTTTTTKPATSAKAVNWWTTLTESFTIWDSSSSSKNISWKREYINWLREEATRCVDHSFDMKRNGFLDHKPQTPAWVQPKSRFLDPASRSSSQTTVRGFPVRMIHVDFPYQWMMKMTLVGPPGVGKTTFTCALRGDPLPKTYVETIGMDFGIFHFMAGKRLTTNINWKSTTYN